MITSKDIEIKEEYLPGLDSDRIVAILLVEANIFVNNFDPYKTEEEKREYAKEELLELIHAKLYKEVRDMLFSFFDTTERILYKK